MFFFLQVKLRITQGNTASVDFRCVLTIIVTVIPGGCNTKGVVMWDFVCLCTCI